MNNVKKGNLGDLGIRFRTRINTDMTELSDSGKKRIRQIANPS